MSSIPLPDPLDVDGDIVVVTDGVRGRRTHTLHAVGLSEGWRSSTRGLLVVADRGATRLLAPKTGRRYPILDWWPAAGAPLPAADGDDLLVCYADGADRRVVRLWPRSRPGWPQWWAGQGHRFAMAGSAMVERDTDVGRIDVGPVLGWARIGADVEALAREWRVDVDVIRDAADGPEGERA